MNCPGIRGSHIDWFLRCPLYYKFAVHERKVPDIIVPQWAVLGWVMHKALEISIAEDIPTKKSFTLCCSQEKEIVREEVASSWPEVELEDDQIPEVSLNQMLRAQKMLFHFDRVKPKLFEKGDRVELETPFKVCLDEDEDVWYWGRIDVLIFKPDGQIKNLDYKSTRPGWEYKEVPPQLLRYCMAYSLQSGIPMSRMESVLFNLESGRVPTRKWTSSEANTIIDDIVEVVKQIRDMDPDKTPANVGDHCRRLCQYHPSCPAYAEAVQLGKV